MQRLRTQANGAATAKNTGGVMAKEESEDDKAYDDSQSLQPKVRNDDSAQISLP